MTAGDELERSAAKRQRIDAAMRIEAAVFISQQQLDVSGIDAGPRIGRQPPAPVGHRKGAQQLAVAIDDRGRNLASLLQRQRAERDDPGREYAGHDQAGSGR